MNGDVPLSSDELQAWVDGQLPPERAAVVERWLERHPAEAARYADYRLQRVRLREMLAPKSAEVIPWRLSPGAIRATRRARNLRLARALAASIVLLAAGGAAGWTARGRQAPTEAGQLATEAVQAHVTYSADIRHPVEVDAAQEAHLVTWLSNRLKHPLKIPDLSAFGFRLVGGRLLPNDGMPAAQFMYEDEAGSRLTLYLHQEPGPSTGFEMIDRSGVTGFRWFDGGFGYVILAPASRGRLLGIAETVYRQIGDPSSQ